MTTLKFAAAAAVSIACALAMAAPAHSADTPTTAQPAATPAAPKGQDPNQVICKRDGEIGSRLGGDKECHTRAQWEQVAHAKSGSAGTAH